MSAVIPSRCVEYVRRGAPGEARLAVNKIGGTNDDPILVMLANGAGFVGFSQMMMCAIEHAPDDAMKTAWRELATRLTEAVIGEIS